VVSGIGKSGHIARKIAGTLASTGTPSLFVHPAEAAHGDLGMLTPTDLAMLLSNSGETTELAAIIAHSRRFQIPLIAITSGVGSALARQADIVLTLPKVAEACDAGLVPTSSTVMMLALGDALAITCMEKRAFTADHFRVFHPGGDLGARLLRVDDLMHTDMPLVGRDTGMDEVILIMNRCGFGVAGVTNPDGTLCGIITDGDLRRNMTGLFDRKAGQVMTLSPRTVGKGALAQTALALMNQHRITTLFVVDGAGPPQGIVHIQDCLRAGVI
jgi:arabinose-5-phosphate isomerase